VGFCDEATAYDVDQVVETFRLPEAEAETLVPALLVNRELLLETGASQVLVPETSLRQGLLLDLARAEEGRDIEDFSKQVLSSAQALGENTGSTPPTPRTWPCSRCASSTSSRPSTASPSGTACSWKWRRSSTTSATT
jgi:hypothetical protein